MTLAFKVAAVAGGTWSRVIAWKTGGRFCHVELVIDEAVDGSVCFSSREGSGCSIRMIDLTSPKGLWTLVPLNLSADATERIRGFALAMSAAKVRYDYLGILGIWTGHGEHDDHDRFCSEVCIEALQQCAGWWTDAKRWLIDPTALYGMADLKSQAGTSK